MLTISMHWRHTCAVNAKSLTGNWKARKQAGVTANSGGFFICIRKALIASFCLMGVVLRRACALPTCFGLSSLITASARVSHGWR